MNAADITCNQIRELSKCGDRDDTWLTVDEMATKLNMPARIIYSALRKARKDNLLECTRVPYTDISGRITSVPAYRIKKN